MKQRNLNHKRDAAAFQSEQELLTTGWNPVILLHTELEPPGL